MGIYVIHAEGTNCYKIGITDKNAEGRLSQLQVGSPQKLRMVRLYQFAASTETETAIHDSLKKYSIHGEWFALPNANVVDEIITSIGIRATQQPSKPGGPLYATDLFGNEIKAEPKYIYDQGGSPSDTNPPGEELTTSKVAAMLGISRAQLITIVNRHKNLRPARKIGQDFFWSKDEVEAVKRTRAKARRGRPSLSS